MNGEVCLGVPLEDLSALRHLKRKDRKEIKGRERCREPLGCAQSVTRSWDERGTCKAALPLGVVPGARYVSFLFLSYCCWAFY